ncbi:hypothetical protein VTN02DRAFT_4156 [Thermoascus thermophilus]
MHARTTGGGTWWQVELSSIPTPAKARSTQESRPALLALLVVLNTLGWTVDPQPTSPPNTRPPGKFETPERALQAQDACTSISDLNRSAVDDRSTSQTSGRVQPPGRSGPRCLFGWDLL